MATRIFAAPSGMASATVSWSRSREASLSMEHQIRFLRSRVDSSARVAGPWIPSSSASAWGEKSGRSPLSSIARWAILCKSERCCLSSVFVMMSPIEIWPYSVPSHFHLAVKNPLRHLCRDDVAHDNDPNEQKERNGQWVKTKNPPKRCRGHAGASLSGHLQGAVRDHESLWEERRPARRSARPERR